MFDKSEIFIVIAAYNEEKKIGKVLAGLKKEGYKKIVVVDDGSTDRTFGVIAKYDVFALRHIINRGQGAALKTGIDFSLEKDAKVIVTFDADGQFLAKEIPQIVLPVIENKADVCLGSRFLGEAINIPFLKKLVLKAGIIVVALFYGTKITDSQCGFRALSRKAAMKIELSADRMEHAADIFSEISRNKLKYTEVPVTVIYDDYALKKGQHWTRSISIGLKMLFNRFMR